jgi:hypothetical protein
MEDQLTMVFQGVMEEAMIILQAEEVAAAAASSSKRGPKHRRRYVNRDCEAAHFRLRLPLLALQIQKTKKAKRCG